MAVKFQSSPSFTEHKNNICKLFYLFIYPEFTRGCVVPSTHFSYLWKLMQLFNKYVIQLLGQELVMVVTASRNLL